MAYNRPPYTLRFHNTSMNNIFQGFKLSRRERGGKGEGKGRERGGKGEGKGRESGGKVEERGRQI